MNRALVVPIFLFFLFSSHLMNALEHNTIMHKLYDVDESFFCELDNIDESDAYKDVCLAYYYFWDGIVKDNQSSLDTTSDLLQCASDEICENDSLFMFMRILQLRVSLMNKEYLSMFRFQHDVKRLVAKPNLLSGFDALVLALYDYFSEYARSERLVYSVLLSSWPLGDRPEGITQLICLSESESEFISTEAHYFLGRIYLEHLGNRSMAYTHFKCLVDRYPHNSIFQMFYEQCEIPSEEVCPLKSTCCF